jgi:NAD(P)-dependent dehydrogenase (short-subunit alcohol dehydrogenase family)
VTTPWRLDGQVALVTGASSGLGARAAAALACAGARVAVTARRGPLLRPLVEELGCFAVSGDLRDAAFRTRLVAAVQERYGGLDILVNNAGSCDAGPLEDQPLEMITEVLELNLVAAVDLCRLAAPLLFRRPGTVVNVASIFGVVGSRSPMVGYNTSKAGLVNLTRHLAAQWGPRGVRVNALAPGFFPTPLTGGLADPEQRARIIDRTLLRRVPELAELDGPLLFLTSAAASYVTGHVLTVDGGWTAA